MFPIHSSLNWPQTVWPINCHNPDGIRLKWSLTLLLPAPVRICAFPVWIFFIHLRWTTLETAACFLGLLPAAAGRSGTWRRLRWVHLEPPLSSSSTRLPVVEVTCTCTGTFAKSPILLLSGLETFTTPRVCPCSKLLLSVKLLLRRFKCVKSYFYWVWVL